MRGQRLRFFQTIPLLLLGSGLRFSFRPLEIEFLAILQFVGQKMAIYSHVPQENGSKYSKPSNFAIAEVVRIFVCKAHQSINKKQYSWNLTFTVFSGTYEQVSVSSGIRRSERPKFEMPLKR